MSFSSRITKFSHVAIGPTRGYAMFVPQFFSWFQQSAPVVVDLHQNVKNGQILFFFVQNEQNMSWSVFHRKAVLCAFCHFSLHLRKHPTLASLRRILIFQHSQYRRFRPWFCYRTKASCVSSERKLSFPFVSWEQNSSMQSKLDEMLNRVLITGGRSSTWPSISKHIYHASNHLSSVAALHGWVQDSSRRKMLKVVFSILHLFFSDFMKCPGLATNPEQGGKDFISWIHHLLTLTSQGPFQRTFKLIFLVQSRRRNLFLVPYSFTQLRPFRQEALFCFSFRWILVSRCSHTSFQATGFIWATKNDGQWGREYQTDFHFMAQWLFWDLLVMSHLKPYCGSKARIIQAQVTFNWSISTAIRSTRRTDPTGSSGQKLRQEVLRVQRSFSQKWFLWKASVQWIFFEVLQKTRGKRKLEIVLNAFNCTKQVVCNPHLHNFWITFHSPWATRHVKIQIQKRTHFFSRLRAFRKGHSYKNTKFKSFADILVLDMNVFAFTGT